MHYGNLYVTSKIEHSRIYRRRALPLFQFFKIARFYVSVGVNFVIIRG